MNTYLLGLYEKSMPDFLSLKEKLFETKKAGFDFMEISIDETDKKLSRLKWNDEERLKIISDMYETGTRINTMCLSGHRKYPLGSEDEMVRSRGMEIMNNAISLAADIGIRIIQIAGYDEYYNTSNENTKKLFSENLKKSVLAAAQKGVILAFETMETEFMNTTGKAMDYVKENNSLYLCVYPDLGNISNAAFSYGTSIVDDLNTARGNIAALHLKETKPGKYREIPYGTGNVDFVTGIKTVYEMGVRIFVGEFWYTGNEDWQKQLEYSNKFLRDKFAAATDQNNI